jgi:ADP-ribosylglycohydrolase
MEGALARRVANALYGMLIADALAMPVHWFYNPADIVKQVLSHIFLHCHREFA